MLSIDAKLDYDTLRRICLTGHSRVPVYEEVEIDATPPIMAMLAESGEAAPKTHHGIFATSWPRRQPPQAAGPKKVKVKKIKPKGKGLPVNTPAYWEEVVDEEEEFEGFGNGNGMVNGHLDLDQDYEMDSDEDDYDEEDDEGDTMEEDEEDDEEESEEGEGDGYDQDIGQRGRQAVERLKDDLSTEEGSEEELEEGESHNIQRGCC